MSEFYVIGVGEEGKEHALAFSSQHNITLLQNEDDILQDKIALQFSDGDTALIQRDGKKFVKVAVDFAEGSLAHRRQFGGGKGQMIAKAIGVSTKNFPHVFDATAGLGRDAFVLATLGCQVTMMERSPAVRMLLSNGLERAKIFAEEEGDHELQSILTRMHLSSGNSIQEMPSQVRAGQQFDVVYLDPMFPERKKSAMVKKDMRMFHQLVGEDVDADDLLAVAVDLAEYRVVVKRPKNAPFLMEKSPSYQLKGKSSRFDIYANKAFPSK